MGQFYSYLWLRSDGSPYYAGKGCGIRAFRNQHGVHRPRSRDNILVFQHASEAEAFKSERAFIQWFGRKNNGTGILRNLTDGGEGVSGLKHSETAKQKISQKLIGHLKTKGMTGRHHSEETKQKMRMSSKGQIPWSKGKQLSESHKQKLRSAAFVREARKREQQCLTLMECPI